MKKIFPIFFLVSVLLLSPAGAEAAFTSDLSFGARGTAVSDLQRFLAEQDLYAGPVTGNYLGLTREAVRRFQLREGIAPAAGYFGPKTRARANELQAGNRAALQAQLQELLKQLTALQNRAATSTDQAAQINARAIVGMNCYFRYLPTGQLINLGKGSGVIVSSNGLILTARHLVDPFFSLQVDPTSVDPRYALNTEFSHCDVGQVPENSVLPSPELIRRSNPVTLVPFLAYRAAIAHIPGDAGLSDLEETSLDFALLRVTGISGEAPHFGVTRLPAAFEYAPLFSGRDPAPGAEVLTYGYPGDAAEARQSAFGTFYLAGSVGQLKDIRGGDRKFDNKPLVVNTNMEVRRGRSGSPLFYKGHVLGIVTAHAAQNATDSFSVHADAIRTVLREAGISLP